jgi:hypothetical protein
MKLEGFYISQFSWAVERMREAGLNDVIISSIIADIRNIAVCEEYRRIQEIIKNPPYICHYGEIKRIIEEDYERPDGLS